MGGSVGMLGLVTEKNLVMEDINAKYLHKIFLSAVGEKSPICILSRERLVIVHKSHLTSLTLSANYILIK